MVAAATTSLPERLEGGRNYDYRYAWIRDQCYAGLAVAAHGPHPLLAGAVRFVTERLLDDGPDLMPAYTVAGEPIPDERALRLRGFPGGSRAGREHGTRPVPAGRARRGAVAAGRRGRARHARRGRLAGGRGRRRGDREAVAGPDAGIWELGDEHWAHSRLACVSGLRAIAAAAGDGPPGGHGHREAARWSALADAITASLERRACTLRGRWQRAPDDERVDAALLLRVVRGGLPPEDPRNRRDGRGGARRTRRRRVRLPVPARRPAAAQGRGRVPALRVLDGAGEHASGNPVAAAHWFERNRARLRARGALHRGVRRPPAAAARQPAAGVRARRHARVRGHAVPRRPGSAARERATARGCAERATAGRGRAGRFGDLLCLRRYARVARAGDESAKLCGRRCHARPAPGWAAAARGASTGHRDPAWQPECSALPHRWFSMSQESRRRRGCHYCV